MFHLYRRFSNNKWAEEEENEENEEEESYHLSWPHWYWNWLSVLMLFITAGNVFCIIWNFNYKSAVYYMAIFSIPRCLVWWVNILWFSHGVSWRFPFWKWFKFEKLTFTMLASAMFYYLIQKQEHLAGQLSYDELCFTTAAFSCLILTQMCMTKLLTTNKVCQDILMLRWYKYGNQLRPFAVPALHIHLEEVVKEGSLPAFLLFVERTFEFYEGCSERFSEASKALEEEKETDRGNKAERMERMLAWYESHVANQRADIE